MSKDYSFDLKPQQGVFIRFSDETGLKRLSTDLSRMIGRMKAVANDFGFDLDMWGNDKLHNEAMNYYMWKKKEPKIDRSEE